MFGRIILAVLFGLVGTASAVSTNCYQLANNACITANVAADPTSQNININWTFLTGKDLTFSNFGIQFNESDTNPSCSAGDYKIYADLSETKLKKCQDGTVTDLASTSGGSVAWDAITNPVSANLSLTMGAFTSTFTSNSATGAGTNMHVWKDSSGNTGTGAVGSFQTAATSNAKPISVTARGTANGAEMNTAGLLAKIGSGSIQADDVVCADCIGASDVAPSAVLFNELANPGGNSAFTVGNQTIAFTYGTATGSSVNMFALADGAGNSGTGALFAINTATTSAASVFKATALGTINGVSLGTGATPTFAAIGAGVNQANDVVCAGSGCIETADISAGAVGTTDIANNAVDGTKIALGTQAAGDLMFYNGTDWVQLAAGTSAQVLIGGSTPAFAGISSSQIGAGDLANALVWNETPSGTSPNLTLANSPRSASPETLLLVVNGIVQAKVGSCGGANEYTRSGTTVTQCVADTGQVVRAIYEL